MTMYYNYIIEDYTGVTTSVYSRNRSHKSMGKNVEKTQVIKAFENKQDALDYETYLQKTYGYKGTMGGTAHHRGSNGRAKTVMDKVTGRVFDCLRTACDELELTLSTVKYHRSKNNSRIVDINI